MSTARNRFSGTGEKKSSFAMTCNRLSLFLKEKGSFRDLGIDSTFDVTGKLEISSPATVTDTVTETKKTTVDFLSNFKSPIETPEKTDKSKTKSVNLLPEFVSLDSFCKPDGSANKPVVSSESKTAKTAKTANMTIFYRGEVLVFDHITADKARDLMLTATGASSGNHIQNRIPLTSTSNSSFEGFESQDQILRGLQANGSDLPIARRSSLHKFLAKRKDRAAGRAPYQLPNRLIGASSSSHHEFDLNL